MLRGLDLILPRGTITAVVGRSGAGKSTVASLISRFYEPDSGAIWLGGRPATDFSRGEWAKAVALVSQEPVLFSGRPSIWLGMHWQSSTGSLMHDLLYGMSAKHVLAGITVFHQCTTVSDQYQYPISKSIMVNFRFCLCFRRA